MKRENERAARWKDQEQRQVQQGLKLLPLSKIQINMQSAIHMAESGVGDVQPNTTKTRCIFHFPFNALKSRHRLEDQRQYKKESEGQGHMYFLSENDSQKKEALLERW